MKDQITLKQKIGLTVFFTGVVFLVPGIFGILITPIDFLLEVLSFGYISSGFFKFIFYNLSRRHSIQFDFLVVGLFLWGILFIGFSKFVLLKKLKEQTKPEYEDNTWDNNE